MIVEDGSGIAEADSLVDLTVADAYHAARGRGEWASASAEQREAALVRATDFICLSYQSRWLGNKTTATQGLCWPRAGISGVEDNVIPREIVAATAEAALDALRGALSTATTTRTIQSVDVGGAIAVTFADEAAVTTGQTTIQALVAPYVTPSGRSIRMERVW